MLINCILNTILFISLLYPCSAVIRDICECSLNVSNGYFLSSVHYCDTVIKDVRNSASLNTATFRGFLKINKLFASLSSGFVCQSSCFVQFQAEVILAQAEMIELWGIKTSHVLNEL